MKIKNVTKCQKNKISNKVQNESKKQIISNQKTIKTLPKKHESTSKLNLEKKSTKLIEKQNLLSKPKTKIVSEDSSTNCLSGSNYKKINLDINNSKPKIKDINREKNIRPLLLSKHCKQKETETESFFINFKLGEKDPYIECITKGDEQPDKNNIFKKINLKNNIPNFKYDYCRVNGDCEKNENDSLEIFDFNDENNVKYILNNLSALSFNKSGKNETSNIFENCNEGIEDKNDNEKIINDIKIFEIKNKIININSKNA